MSKLLLTLTIALSVSTAFAADDSTEAGTPRALRVAKDPAVKGIEKSLSKQPSLDCFLETLGNTGAVLVTFYSENSISKFSVGVNCIGSTEMSNQSYEIKGILGDGGILIDSVIRSQTK